MTRNTTTIPAGRFKARCLALLDEVASTGRTILVTRRGKVVARVVPVDHPVDAPLLGSVIREGDIITPIDFGFAANR